MSLFAVPCRQCGVSIVWLRNPDDRHDWTMVDETVAIANEPELSREQDSRRSPRPLRNTPVHPEHVHA